MGCCQSQLDISEIDLNQLNKRQNTITPQADEFNDLSLSSPSEENMHQETCVAHIQDSIVYYTRSTSLSLHRSDLENVFLHTSQTHRMTDILHTNPDELNIA